MGNLVLLLLFLASGSSAVLGNFLLKAGINHLGGFNIDFAHLQTIVIHPAANWQIIVGFILYGLSSILYLKILSLTEVTRIYPALVAYMSVVLLILGVFFLRESLTLGKIAGTALVIFGIFFISK